MSGYGMSASEEEPENWTTVEVRFDPERKWISEGRVSLTAGPQ